MPPEGYEERRREKIVNDFLEYINSGRSNYKRLSAKEQVKRLEMERLKSHLAKSMVEYVRQNPN
jgi:hypothetical protein|tara:strand:+ start:326 stop:517 length:192 start_codon:yes stop_codon:yes gene_type:complete